MRKSGKGDAPEGSVTDHLCSQVAVLRKKRRWTLAQLSSISGVSRSMLSQIERNQANPTLAVAYRIAKAFGLSLNDIVDHPAELSQIEIHRAEDLSRQFRSDYDCRIRMLSPRSLEKNVEFYEVLIHPGKTLVSAPHMEGTREIVTLQRGTIHVTVGADASDLRPGDMANYPGDKPHSMANTGSTEAVVYLVNVFRRS